MSLGAATRRLVLAGVLLGCSLAPSAQAATVSQQVVGQPSFPNRQLNISALPGERNELSLSVGVAAGEIVVGDAGSPLSAEGECRARPDGSVSCPEKRDGMQRSIGMRLGDEDDVATVGPGVGAVFIAGGAGADRLTGGGGSDTLDGGDGPDILSGGAGDDRFYGEGSLDDPYDDLMDGGSGVDIASYAAYPVPITVRMSDGTIDSAEQRDRFVRVEGVEGGRGPDVMIGSRGADVLDGGSGADRIDGGAGDDVLVGGLGRDTVSAGQGDDLIDGSLPGDRQILCGPGNDVQRPANGRRVQVRCERVALAGNFAIDTGQTVSIGARPVRVGGRTVIFDVRCPGGSESCTATLRLRANSGRLLGRSRRTRIRAGRHAAVSIRCKTVPRRAAVRVDADLQLGEPLDKVLRYLTRLR